MVNHHLGKFDPAPRGVPQIEVILDINSNGILHVSAVDKSSGKIIGDLSKKDIERMMSDGEKFKAEDDKQKERIAAKNNLESYCFNMKSTIEEEKLKDKIGKDERKTIMDKCNEVIAWLNANKTADEDEYKDKQKEVHINFLFE